MDGTNEPFLMLNLTYYHLCQISLAYTLNMTSLDISTQYTSTNTLSTTMDKPLIEWNIVNISIPNNNCTLNTTFQDHPLWLFGSIANDFSSPGESNFAGEVGESTVGESTSSEAYIAVDDIILTYCLPCNFDILNESGTCA